jgi:hypothetical protein
VGWRVLRDQHQCCAHPLGLLAGALVATASLQRAERCIPNFDFQKSLVGKKVRIYWPLEEHWYPGTVTRYNASLAKFKVEYDVRDAGGGGGGGGWRQGG